MACSRLHCSSSRGAAEVATPRPRANGVRKTPAWHEQHTAASSPRQRGHCCVATAHLAPAAGPLPLEVLERAARLRLLCGLALLRRPFLRPVRPGVAHDDAAVPHGFAAGVARRAHLAKRCAGEASVLAHLDAVGGRRGRCHEPQPPVCVNLSRSRERGGEARAPKFCVTQKLQYQKPSGATSSGGSQQRRSCGASQMSQ